MGITVSGMISKAGRLNYPIAAVSGDAQRYQGTKLVWPVVGPNGFDPSFNPIKEGVGKQYSADFQLTLVSQPTSVQINSTSNST